MKEILVPCDFSRAAVNAFCFALDMASQAKAKVHLIHVIELPVLADGVIMPVATFEQPLLKELKDEAVKHFREMNEKYNHAPVKVSFDVQFGVVSRMIQNYIKDFYIDLVVMGSHGASGFRELLIGSNAEKMVRRSPVPVLVVKEYYKGPIKNIVFPNALNEDGQEDLIQKIKQLQDFFKAHLHVVWINTPLNFTTDSVTIPRLEEFAMRFMLKDYTVSVFNHLDEEQGIIEFSSLVKGDLVAIGTHARKGISHLMNGSLAEDVVNHNKGLVWTYALKKVPVEI